MAPPVTHMNNEGRVLSPTFTHKPDDKTRSERHHEDEKTTNSTTSPQIPVQKNTPDKKAEMDLVREMLHEFGPDRFAIYVYAGLLGISTASLIGFFLLSWSWITAIIAILIGFVIVSPLSPSSKQNLD
jgi:hypothetical protein